MKQKIPDDAVKFMEIFTQLCEDYADENDDFLSTKSSARDNLLDFCHAYAYKVNGIEVW